MSFNVYKSLIPYEKLILRNKRIILRPVTDADCTPTYVAWLQDSNVNQFLETRWSEQNIDTIRAFVQKMSVSEDNFLFAIRVRTTGTHIGNIKIGPINRNHGYADISYFIGDRQYWGKGFATEAIKLVTKFAFEVLQLYRVQAGAYERNIGSIRALQKAGFCQEGCLRKQLACDGGRDNHLWFGVTLDEWRIQT